jgi:hypothetical protein
MSNKCSAANPTGVYAPSQPPTSHFGCSTSMCPTMMSRTMRHHSPMCFRRTFSAPSSRPLTSGLKSQLSCTAYLPQITSKSRKSRCVERTHPGTSFELNVFTQAVVWVPQRGSNNGIELPSQLPKEDALLKDLEPLGWIKTQALELAHLSPSDVTTQAKLMADHPEWGSSSICMTASFTPGSVSLSAHSLTVAGFEWGRKNTDNSPNAPVS